MPTSIPPPAAVGDSVRINAAADQVWTLVSDVTRMPRWSPELSAARWIDGSTGPSIGARFTGTNRRGLRRWSTTCTVTELEPGRRLTYRVTSVFGLPVADWTYLITPRDGGCELAESTVDRRGRFMRAAGLLATGVRRRGPHNLAGIRATLAAIKSAAEER